MKCSLRMGRRTGTTQSGVDATIRLCVALTEGGAIE